MTDPEPRGILKWDEIDKFKFFSVGTAVYSGLTVILHPMTVLKIRQQVLNSSAKSVDHLKHQQTLKSTFQEVMTSSGVRGLFRGAGTVVSLAIPARVVYICVLEESRQEFSHVFTDLSKQFYSQEQASAMMPWIKSLSGGLAGGLAAMMSQVLVVPMDVISQKQMIMSQEQYMKEGSVAFIIESELKAGGKASLFRGFGLSLFTSLPTGSVWWATYGGCQHWMDDHFATNYHTTNSNWSWLAQQGTTQVVSGLTAAAVAASLTQPLDCVRARLQVGVSGSASSGMPGGSSLSSLQVARELAKSSGVRGFFRGLGPRTFHLSVWGTILSSAYELLRHYSRKDPP